MSCVPDLVVEEVEETIEEVSGVLRGFGRVHARKGDLGDRINHREDVPLLPTNPQDDGVERDEEAGKGFLLERGDALLLLRSLSFGLCSLVFLGMKLQIVLPYGVLHFP